MQFSRLVAPVCLALACAAVVFGASGARSAGNAPPVVRGKIPHSPAAPSAAPAPSATPACDKPVTIGEMTLCSQDLNFNFKNGDFQFPNPVHGRTADGTYQADRGYGNLHSQTVNLIGHVVVHRDASKDKSGKPVEAMTLTANQTHVESKAKYYRASGNVKVVQGELTLTAPLLIDDEAHRVLSASGGVKVVKGDKTLTAPQIVLDETTHVAHLTGGVHAEQKPDRSFDSAEVLYNTSTEDFKALGGVRLQFPATQLKPVSSSTAKPSPPPSSSARSRASPAPRSSPAPSPAASPKSL
jgi:lipopolysaccharide assembly outer membrane protein LptD (OstA)